MSRINLLIPIAGRAQRFIDAGFTAPKPLVMVDDEHMIDLAMRSIKHDDCNLIFVVRKDHVTSFSIDTILRAKFGDDIKIVVLDHITQGTLCTCLEASQYINNENPLVIYTPDVYFEDQFDPYSVDDSLDGLLLTFKANSPAHSYARMDEEGYVVETAEKEVISDQAAVGVYYFKSGEKFVEYARAMIKADETVNGEFYVCPIYNRFIENRPEHRKTQIMTELVSKMHVLGTPEDLDFFTSRVLPRFGEKKPVALCADHSGYQTKELMKEVLTEFGISFVDFGTYTETDCDHYDFLSQAIRHIYDGHCDFGMAFCRTGQGFNIAANKAANIRSALVVDADAAMYARRHNAADFFCVPAIIDKTTLRSIVASLAAHTFDGGRHLTRIRKVEQDEEVFGV